MKYKIMVTLNLVEKGAVNKTIATITPAVITEDGSVEFVGEKSLGVIVEKGISGLPVTTDLAVYDRFDKNLFGEEYVHSVPKSLTNPKFKESVKYLYSKLAAANGPEEVSGFAYNIDVYSGVCNLTVDCSRMIRLLECSDVYEKLNEFKEMGCVKEMGRALLAYVSLRIIDNSVSLSKTTIEIMDRFNEEGDEETVQFN